MRILPHSRWLVIPAVALFAVTLVWMRGEIVSVLAGSPAASGQVTFDIQVSPATAPQHPGI